MLNDGNDARLGARLVLLSVRALAAFAFRRKRNRGNKRNDACWYVKINDRRSAVYVLRRDGGNVGHASRFGRFVGFGNSFTARLLRFACDMDIHVVPEL